jgi:hypothetical protein
VGLIDQKTVFKAYLYFHKHKYGQSHCIGYTPKTQNLCDTFIKLLHQRYESLDRIGVDFLWIYLVFQFKYWGGVDIKAWNGKINPALVIGKKAFNRFQERDQSFDWQILEDEREYSRKQYNEAVQVKTQETEIGYDSDNIYRRQYLNHELGLSNCITYTSLFNPRSACCKQCQYQQQCSEVQQQLYPQVYNDRKIENGSKATTRQQQIIPNLRRRAV